MIEQKKSELSVIPYIVAGVVGFFLGGCYASEKCTNNLTPRVAFVSKLEGSRVERLHIMYNGNYELFLIKPEGYTNFVSSEFYKSNELEKLERKLNLEVKVK
ncbi:MAG: hypothetical protein AABX11_04445 [Nanoarchaeota archaeon]